LDDGILEGSRYEGEAEAASSFLLTVSWYSKHSIDFF
jgi:hypothetical protein